MILKDTSTQTNKLRTHFLNQLYQKIVDAGFQFVSEPDIREFKHGNLKFTDSRLNYIQNNIKVFITLEHYHIKREGWHPLYWGLQSFDCTTNLATEPENLVNKIELIKKLESKILEKSSQKLNLDISEPKYGWFAWHCFQFSDITSNLDDERINDVLIRNGYEILEQIYFEFFVYLQAWQEIVLENG